MSDDAFICALRFVPCSPAMYSGFDLVSHVE